MKSRKFYIPVLIFFLSVFSVFGQTRKQLEEQRKKLNYEIKQVNSLLFKEKKKVDNALEDLNDLNRKISVRAKLIAIINAEARILSKEIRANETELKKLKKKLADLKADYADIILKSYKSKSQQSRMMFLLSSQNFHQAYKRFEYMKQYTAYRKKQGEEIVIHANEVLAVNDSLLVQKSLKDKLIASENEQKKEIEEDKRNQEKLLAAIKKKESSYKKELQSKVKEEKRVTVQIDRKIREEIERANRIARAKLKDKPSNSKPTVVKKNEFILSPEAKALAAKFELNKGKLPWPVSEGIVVRRFGTQPHPSFPGITVNGTGLHIVTKQGIKAQSIFNGRVLNILVSAEGRKNVLIQHGNYISSYNNLEKVTVKKGDVVITGQAIGQVFTDKVSKKTKLVFVLFKNTTRLNPSSWILRR
ncbi:peptidoglycan DD-metalloendopeptidase family protein [Polaribacter undariae]|uniref:Peptidoglycan DD-metalloendopeptidase family protein n=1 Tax=Polaribacter sejongensis TaxID=985043 RepID=A0AAJ1QZH8_9FLAO|nr:peptidoglycan DD-metalloendopeptidase family protein [Polaribacter undariae]MDN3620980.1 peptidoglycan DD-metalloendopeptidase family protein [Polaribacter undariae]UWD31113.1 peptidoglycan DD-metalloendopeptidase family protein [Polaribacter undariae]